MTTSTNDQLFRAAPVAWVAEVHTAIEYYRQRLGFECQHVDRHEDRAVYAVMLRDTAEVHLSGAHPERAGTASYHLLVQDPDALYEEYRAAGVDVVEPPRDRPYGMRAFFFRDGDGNLIEAGVNHRPDR